MRWCNVTDNETNEIVMAFDADEVEAIQKSGNGTILRMKSGGSITIGEEFESVAEEVIGFDG